MLQTAHPPRMAAACRGFTLIELMIAVAVIGILAAVAMPAYTDHVKRGKLTEAFSQLSAQSLNMEQFYQDNRTYVGAPPCQAPIDSKYFTTTCSTATASDYTLKATAKSGSGVDGAIYTINRNGLRTTLGMPTGWTVPSTNCWGTDRAGSCQ